MSNLPFVAAEAKDGIDGTRDETLFVVTHSITSRMDRARKPAERLLL